MIDLRVAFPVLSSKNTEEEFRQKLDEFIDALTTEGYLVPITSVTDSSAFSKED